jgi:hypothetical protein
MIKATFVINFKDKKPVKSLAAILLFALYAATTFSQSNVQAKCMINVKVDKPIATVQPTMWGIFFEDINMGADGGIYAELVRTVHLSFINHWLDGLFNRPIYHMFLFKNNLVKEQ